MHFEVGGNKNGDVCLLFLHGWGGSLSSFSCIVNAMAFSKYKIVSVDFPGFGKTKVPSRPYMVSDYADEVLALISKLKLKKIVLVGHSFGGRVSLKLGSKNLKEIIGVVLVDSAGLKPKKSIRLRFKLLSFRFAKMLVKIGVIDKKKLDKYGSSDYKLLSGTMKKTFVNVVNEDLTRDAKNIAVKTLIVWGDKDKETPIYMAKRLNKLIKCSKLIVYKGCGHFCYLENTNDFLFDLTNFLSEL